MTGAERIFSVSSQRLSHVRDLRPSSSLHGLPYWLTKAEKDITRPEICTMTGIGHRSYDRDHSGLSNPLSQGQLKTVIQVEVVRCDVTVLVPAEVSARRSRLYRSQHWWT